MSQPGEGNRQWIREALATYEGPLLRYARRLLHSEEAARDVVQETFLRLCRARPSEVDGHCRQWLYRVCRQRATDRMRKEGRMSLLDETHAEVQASREPAPDEAAQLHEAQSDLLRQLAALPARQREVLELKFAHGLKYREIADVLGLTTSNVGVLIHTALVRLRVRLAEHQAEA